MPGTRTTDMDNGDDEHDDMGERPRTAQPGHPITSPRATSSSFATIVSSATTGSYAAGGGGVNHRTGGTIKVAAGYILRERLGSGSFATVYRGVRLPAAGRGAGNADGGGGGGVDVAAIKAISRSSKKLTKKVLENLDMEISILRTYRHPNIVCLHDVQKTERHFYLVLEYCAGGDLQHLIRTRKVGRLSERLVRRLVRDLTAGLGFLWGKELVHRDIKPQNLLLTGPLPVDETKDPPARAETEEESRSRAAFSSFSLKIADFGFARHLAATSLAETLCGSPLYMAPEILQGQKYDAKADLWSAGTVLFEMIAGKPPFHGENHLDLLRNIQRKAVRLPPDVRVSPELVKLLRLLLNRNPLSRAGFREFFHASDAFVGLGCGGTPATAQGRQEGDGRAAGDHIGRMQPLCAISENDGGGGGAGEASEMDGTASLVTVATMDTVHPLQQQPTAPPAFVPLGLAQKRPNAAPMPPAQSRQDQKSPRAGVVTPPFQPASAPSPPSALPTAGGYLEPTKQARSSVFAPLQSSPNVSPSSTPPLLASPPVLSLRDASASSRGNPPQPRPSHLPLLQQAGASGVCPPGAQHLTPAHPTQASLVAYPSGGGRSGDDMQQPPCRESYDSGFVIVEHSGCSSRPCSGRGSPLTCISQANERSGSPTPTRQHQYQQHGLVSPKTSPRFTIVEERSGNVGILSTSPGTGQALVGKMMGHPPAINALPAPPITGGGGKFCVSPRSALRSGGCLAHIENFARTLAAAEDVGRRTITVAHLGDVRAYMAMGLLVAQRDEGRSSPCASMEEVEEEEYEEFSLFAPLGTSSPRHSARATRFSKEASIGEEEDSDDVMPFAIPISSDDGSANEMMSLSPPNNIFPQPPPNTTNTENTKTKDELKSSMIQLHFREALMCYLKTLSMIKGSIRAAQKVMNDVEEIISLPTVRSSLSNNPYTPIRKRCSVSLKWLTGQFAAVMERADAASDQIAKLQPPVSPQDGVCVEELIYNHSLKCGRDGAVKQLLGHHDSARLCYRSAGLLAEALLMEPKLGEEDRFVLEGYVQSFADQISELDGLIRIQTKSSRLSVTQVQMGSLSGSRRPAWTTSPKLDMAT